MKKATMKERTITRTFTEYHINVMVVDVENQTVETVREVIIASDEEMACLRASYNNMDENKMVIKTNVVLTEKVLLRVSEQDFVNMASIEYK